jgi:hypothetical protein
MKNRRRLVVVVVASLALLAAGIGSQASDGGGVSPSAEMRPAPALMIPYAGTLAADSGGPVADGAYDFAFTLYEAERGGESLWSEVQGGVAVEEGTFATALGSADALPQEALQRATL